MSFDVIQKIIEESLGAPIKELFIEIKETPLGSASIGQTHRATTQRGKPVVVKVIKPGIRETILPLRRKLRRNMQRVIHRNSQSQASQTNRCGIQRDIGDPHKAIRNC